ncbi:MAG: hypothetical protein M1833_003491 [Piccolia ochrophora]|nr:MAG: hypothetical protein M1833_003491 [Piccolia ochrophora]
MADGKRASGGPKIPVATPNITNLVNTVPLETALLSCIGARVRVTTVLRPAPLTGTLFTVSPAHSVLAINAAPPPPTPASAATSTPSPQHPGDYHIIPFSTLHSFHLLSLAPNVPSSFTVAPPQLRPVDLRAAIARERDAVEREVRRQRGRGKGVSGVGLGIFDALSRTLPVRWHDTSIVVLDAVMIAPPYTVEDCRAAAKDSGALQRVKKVLDIERKKVVDRDRGGGAGTPNQSKPAAVPSSAVRDGGRKGG